MPAICDGPCRGVDIRQEPVTQFVISLQNFFDLTAVIPHLRVGMESMDAKDGTERSELEPADQQFVIIRGCVLIGWTEESAGVRCPIGEAGHSEVEAGGNLAPECFPIAGDVT